MIRVVFAFMLVVMLSGVGVAGYLAKKAAGLLPRVPPVVDCRNHTVQTMDGAYSANAAEGYESVDLSDGSKYLFEDGYTIRIAASGGRLIQRERIDHMAAPAAYRHAMADGRSLLVSACADRE